MRIARPVLLSVMLSLPLVPGSICSPAGPTETAEVEPGGVLGASATLVRVLDESGPPQALVRLELAAAAHDARATITPWRRIRPDDTTRHPAGSPVLLALTQGRSSSILLNTELMPLAENHLFFDVRAPGRDGSATKTTVYLRVNLDPALEPVSVAGCLEYEGARSSEVQP